MDIVFTLLKQLAASLSPTEFLMVLVIVAMTAFSAIKFFVKFAKKSGGVATIFQSTSEEADLIKVVQTSVDGIDTKIDTLTASQDKVLTSLTTAVNELKTDSKEFAETLRNQITDLLLLKKDLEVNSEALKKELDNIYQLMKMHDVIDTNAFDTMKDSLGKIHNTAIRIISQLEKTDEFARAFVPEFRSYHKDLNKELNDLSRDVALVERSIQTQINTVNAVKLR